MPLCHCLRFGTRVIAFPSGSNRRRFSLATGGRRSLERRRHASLTVPFSPRSSGHFPHLLCTVAFGFCQRRDDAVMRLRRGFAAFSAFALARSAFRTLRPAPTSRSRRSRRGRAPQRPAQRRRRRVELRAPLLSLERAASSPAAPARASPRALVPAGLLRPPRPLPVQPLGRVPPRAARGDSGAF